MRHKFKKPELVSPAGDWSALLSAINSGADSVYFGVKGLSMRNLAGNFDILEIKKVMSRLHEQGCRGYLALNVIVYNSEIPKVKKILKEAKKSLVDGVILWDMAVFSLAKELGLSVHLSTQASVANYEALKYYNRLGAKRIVLARETELKDIKKIISYVKKDGLECEIETFIHGAMCLSVSGRCFLSEHSFGKSANRGECLQPCRREFKIVEPQDNISYIAASDYILSPKDLCSIDFIDSLIEAGINAFKIEGRMRSPEYVKVVTSVYRRAIDYYFEGKLTKKKKKDLKQELSSVYSRGFSSGFYLGKPKDAHSRSLEHTHEKIYLGEVVKYYKKINVAEIAVKNNCLKKGDTILCVGKNIPASFAKIEEIQIEHNFVDRLERGQKGGIKVPFALKRNDKVFVWKKKQQI
ncbi:MAG: U32 family peptidase [Candidatus Omnitrophica bacterium]|nr:U32 family peptidase [Candidatus Omnitrophota bacterium]MDD5430187.1 U32 family peptidase [Candidatus Omnitrophota bacterium]